MHRYEELERVYYKRIILKYTVFIVLIILFIAGFFVLKKTMKQKKEIKHKITAKQVQKKEKKIIKTIKKEKSKEANKSPKIYHFLLPNISQIPVNEKIQNNKKINNTKTVVKKNENFSKKKEIKEVQLNHTANLDKIKITEKTPDLKTLINKFNISKDFDLAILISKIYFQKNNLTDAQIWALRANSINPSSYKSWILFADILLKKKKPKKAKEILKVYINSYGQNDIIEEKLRSLNDE